MEEIKVVNHNEEVLRGRFNGEDFVFEPGVPTVIDLEAAKHIFDLGKEDKSQALNALGWLIPGHSTYKEALAKLDNITFLQGRTVFDEEPVAADSDSPDGPAGAPPSQVPVGSRGRTPKGSASANPTT